MSPSLLTSFLLGKSEPGLSDVHVDRPLGSDKKKKPALFCETHAPGQCDGTGPACVVRKDEGDHWVTIAGQHILVGADGQPKAGNPKVLGSAQDVEIKFEPSERVERAMKAYVCANKEEQKIADEQERKLSEALNMPRTPDNSAFDLLLPGKVGVELKTMIKSKNGKITMSKAALARKNDFVKSAGKGFKTFTVVADKRGGGTKYYYQEGVGSFRVNSMIPVTIGDLRGLLGRYR